MSNFGSELKKALEERGTSLTWLARESGVSIGTIMLIVGDSSHSPRLETCEKIVSAMRQDIGSVRYIPCENEILS